MSIERAFCTNKEHLPAFRAYGLPEMALAKAWAISAVSIASARASFGRISAGGVSNCNSAARGNDAVQHSAHDFSVQFPSAFLN